MALPPEFVFVVEETVQALADGTSSLDRITECLIQSCTIADENFTAVRTKVMSSAMVYRKHHLPNVKKVVMNMQRTITMIVATDSNDFRSLISVFAGELTMHADFAEKVTRHHKCLLEDLKKLRLDIKSVQMDLQRQANSTKNLDGQVCRRPSTGKSKDAWRDPQKAKVNQSRRILSSNGQRWRGFQKAGLIVEVVLWIGVIPAVYAGGNLRIAGGIVCAGLIISKLFPYYNRKGCDENLGLLKAEVPPASEIVALTLVDADVDIFEPPQNVALAIIEGPLIEAVQNFIEAIDKLTRFFKQLAADVAKDAQRMNSDSITSSTDLSIIREYSPNIKEACARYLERVPLAEARLGGLSKFLTSDPNLVDSWLKQWEL